jgi:hypothetical protein
MLANGLAMVSGAIAFVGIKSVLRKCFVKFAHKAVAMDLGDYRGGCNGDRKAVSLHNSLLPYRKRKLVWAVDEEEIGIYCQLANGAGHCPKGCLEDIYPIYFDTVYDPDSNGQCARLDSNVKLFPLSGSEEFRIGDPGETNAFWQDHCGSDHWTCQRPSAGLVYSANKTKAPPVGIPFMETHINRQGFDQLPLHEAPFASFEVLVLSFRCWLKTKN